MGLLDNIAGNINSLRAAGAQKAVEMAMSSMQTQVDDTTKRYGLDKRKSDAAVAQVKAVLTQVACGKMNIDAAKKQFRGPVLNSVLSAASTTNKTEELVTALQGKLQTTKAGKLLAMLPKSITDGLTGEITNMQQRLVSQLSAKATASQLVEVSEVDDDDSLTEYESTEMAQYEEGTTTPEYERHDNGVVVITEETTEEQDQAFIDSLTNVKAPTAATPLQTGQAAMEAVSSLMTMSNEVMKFTEVQKTKRITF